MATAPAPLPRPGDRIGAFTIERELGRGGMGAVFAAHQEGAQRRVALKVLLAAADPRKAERFRREALASAQVEHPHVVPTIDAGVDPLGRCWLAMELVDGESLRGRIERAGPLPQDELRRIGREVASALHAAHARGVIHRDVKPDNILLDAAGRARLADFGLARLLDADEAARLTRTGEILGTPAYMPPEQVAGKGVALDGRADVYALGATLYEALTGRPPFEGDSLITMIAAILGAEPAPPRSLRPDAEPELEAVLLRCLAKDPAGRFQDAAELERALVAGAGPAPSSRPLVVVLLGVLLALVLASALARPPEAIPATPVAPVAMVAAVAPAPVAAPTPSPESDDPGVFVADPAGLLRAHAAGWGLLESWCWSRRDGALRALAHANAKPLVNAQLIEVSAGRVEVELEGTLPAVEPGTRLCLLLVAGGDDPRLVLGCAIEGREETLPDGGLVRSVALRVFAMSRRASKGDLPLGSEEATLRGSSRPGPIVLEGADALRLVLDPEERALEARSGATVVRFAVPPASVTWPESGGLSCGMNLQAARRQGETTSFERFAELVLRRVAVRGARLRPFDQEKSSASLGRAELAAFLGLPGSLEGLKALHDARERHTRNWSAHARALAISATGEVEQGAVSLLAAIEASNEQRPQDGVYWAHEDPYSASQRYLVDCGAYSPSSRQTVGRVLGMQLRDGPPLESVRRSSPDGPHRLAAQRARSLLLLATLPHPLEPRDALIEGELLLAAGAFAEAHAVLAPLAAEGDPRAIGAIGEAAYRLRRWDEARRWWATSRGSPAWLVAQRDGLLAGLDRRR